MENIDINYITKLGWQKYSSYSNAPENCFYKNTYPIALWWDEQQAGFWVINLNELVSKPVIIAHELIKTPEDYDALIIPILHVLKRNEDNLSL